MRPPEVGDQIKYYTDEPIGDNPAPGVVDAVYEDRVIDCTLTFANDSTRQEVGVLPKTSGDPRHWEYA
jgi:hypothetical protein